jgi:ribose 5-phosphate isomerase A
MSTASNDPRTPKQLVAAAAAQLVEDGMTVGLGSGTTAALMVEALGRRVASEGLRLVGVPTSVATADLAQSLGIPLRELDDVASLDLNIDGADEIDPRFQMIKGRGGALLREKIVASAARRRVTVITADKRVEQLGRTAPVPIEVSPVGVSHLAARLEALGATSTIRLGPDGARYVTDGGNLIVDCQFTTIEDAPALDAALQQIVGVFETGLFIGLCDLLIVGHADHVEQVDSLASARR